MTVEAPAVPHRPGSSQRLIAADAALLVAIVVHAGAHVLRHPDGASAVSVPLWIAAGLLVAAVVWALALASVADTRAARAAMLVGFGSVAATLLGHALPSWGPLSASYWADDSHADGATWALLGVVVAAGFWTGTLGARAARAAQRT